MPKSSASRCTGSIRDSSAPRRPRSAPAWARCIATIHYETPGKDDARRLWRRQAAQFGAELGDGLVEALLRAYPKASGRDIKELLKLATRYARAREVPLTATYSGCAGNSGA